MSRYINRNTVENTQFSFRDVLDRRNRTTITHYRTPEFTLAEEEVQESELNFQQHEWKVGDRYWKLASAYYGDPSFWWVIAFYNDAPTENDCFVGRVLRIPTPLDRAVVLTGMY